MLTDQEPGGCDPGSEEKTSRNWKLWRLRETFVRFSFGVDTSLQCLGSNVNLCCDGTGHHLHQRSSSSQKTQKNTRPDANVDLTSYSTMRYQSLRLAGTFRPAITVKTSQ